MDSMTPFNSDEQKMIPVRRKLIINLLKEYNQPVLLSEFVKKHVAELGLQDDLRGRHAATVYINRMVTTKDLAKIKKGRYPHIYVPEGQDVSSSDSASYQDTSVLNPSERRKKILNVLGQYQEPSLLASFINRHISDFGYEKTPKNLATLRAFIYRMSDRGVLKLTKINKSLYLSIGSASTAHDHRQDIFQTKPLTRDSSSTSTTKNIAPQSNQEQHFPLSLEALIEAKNKIMDEMEHLDKLLEEIVTKKKTLKQKRDELLIKIRDLF